MDIDLSRLEATEPEIENGKPMLVDINKVSPDKDQPRRDFSEDAMADMVASIGESGIKSPISIRPNLDKDGYWIINFGERRYRAALANKHETIPCFIDELNNDYDQVTENIQRDALRPIEIALFIDKKVNDGDKKTEIAKKLGKDKTYINKHLALIGMPSIIDEAFNDGRCTSPTSIYLLRNLYEKHKEELDVWIPEQKIITRVSLDNFKKEIINQPAKLVAGEEGSEQNTTSPLESSDISDNEKAEISDDENQEQPKTKPIKEKEIIKKPLLSVLINEREAVLDLKLKPAHQGLIHIVYEDGTRDEVSIESCLLISLVDSNG